jgi:hypothetical protein
MRVRELLQSCTYNTYYIFYIMYDTCDICIVSACTDHLASMKGPVCVVYGNVIAANAQYYCNGRKEYLLTLPLIVPRFLVR